MAQITVDGRLGTDVEMKYLQSGQAVGSFSLAEQHRKKDQSGQWVDDSTSWYRVTLWGKRAETAAESLSKGQPVVITGDLKITEFETRDGGKGKAAEINARTVGVVPVPGRAPQQAPSGGQAGDPWAASTFGSDGGFANDEPPF